ncbi:hypothetical protein AOL_s00076g112 [Orbilia oligospora ATCC 24927]|uniref:Uncharacterized protein n=1 Tax=Arthrobotrys oligospora (strain ATCC 24927 / CBS 115.81 / DSM 1491) TaxID=756982 RepID=G1X905_ARTOA|nr:hypothetical protein AOL_s00076g112 [Orbilia oligospora ATCC 24927]EGX50348.1 hypothetical protein AOL_s00076g112 [Orbilia oligospora ATCC 24927]
MKLRTTLQYLAIGLTAFPIPCVNAALRYMTIENFETWVHGNEAAFTTIGEDLRWLIYLSQIDRPLTLESPDADVARSLETTYENVRSVFDDLQKQSNRGDIIPTEEEGQTVHRDHFFVAETMNLHSMVYEFKINLPRNVWNNRIDKEPLEGVTPIEATQKLVQYLENSGLDLTDPVAVAMWVLDGKDIVTGRGSETTVISYNTASLRTLRSAFKSIFDGYKAIAEVINRIYNDAGRRYQDPLYQEPLFAIETPLRRLQNFMFAYQNVFSDRPPLKIPVRSTT